MGQSQILKPFFLVIAFLTSFPVLGFCSEYTTYVFKACASQQSEGQTVYFSQTLDTLFGTLIPQSSTKFGSTTVSSGQTSISGAFQCRGDLSGSNCRNCVKEASRKSKQLCGDSVAGRVQLVGCHVRYWISGFKQPGATDFLFNKCPESKRRGLGFTNTAVDTALEEMASNMTSGNGFYKGEYNGSVKVLAQCEGDLGVEECVGCVKKAAEWSKRYCSSAISAQIYLQQCYISYLYGHYTLLFSGLSLSHKTGAIICGVLVAALLVCAFFLYLVSLLKGEKNYYYRSKG